MKIVINLPIKALIGLGVAGAVGGGGYGIYRYLSNSKTLADILEGEKIPLLKVEGTADDTKWDKKVSEYASSSESPKLSGYEKTGEDTAKHREEMKNACKNLLSTPIDKVTDEIKNQVKKWCADSGSEG